MNELGQGTAGPVHRRVFGLDALRASAILAVVLAHSFVVLYPHFGDALGFFGHGGFYGVELFFFLIGFLIGQILLRAGGHSCQQFLRSAPFQRFHGTEHVHTVVPDRRKRQP